ncbi:MAG: zinc-ribbon domain-containing protein [Candidatus Coatesbacteria bacterium]|nr:zinc-ribbon domain-containing protein [Candidatus Coatesbacteria bacterium]
MIITCPSCGAKYKIPEERISEKESMRVKCKKCSNVFTVSQEQEKEKVVLDKIAEQSKDTKTSPAATQETDEKKKSEFESFLEALPPQERKAHMDARRLARVLASDIVAYNKEKIEKGRKDSNLVEVLKPEIRKSWSLYKRRIPPQIIDKTDYFLEALNEIVLGEK